MQDLSKENKDFTVTATGQACISQTAISKVTGIPQQTLSDWIRTKSVDYNTNELNQLDAKSFQKVVILGSPKYPSCLTFMGTLLEAGAKAYIYHQAGYKLDATMPPPTTFLEAMQVATKEMEVLETLATAQPS